MDNLEFPCQWPILLLDTRLPNPEPFHLRFQAWVQCLEMQHKTPVFTRKYSAPKNRKIERPEVANRIILKYHAVRVVDVDYVS